MIAAWLVVFCLGATVSADDVSLDALIDELAQVPKKGLGKIGKVVDKIAKLKNPAAIPKLIGIIDSDNSDKTIYHVGSFGLGPLTGVDYDELHHGPWWRKWWAENKTRFPKEVQDIRIPIFPLTQRGREFAANPPEPDSIILEPTADDYLTRIKTILESGNTRDLSTPCRRLVELRDERVIPKLIGLMAADNSQLAIEQIGLALSSMTEVRYHASRHGSWWRAWWQANRAGFPKAAQEIVIPDYPRTEHGKQFALRVEGQPVFLDPTLDDLLKLVGEEVAAGASSSSVGDTADWIVSYENPRAIEPLIKLIAQDQSGELQHAVGKELRRLTDIGYDASHDGHWWTSWWEEHKSEINRRIDRATEPPSGNLYLPKHRRKAKRCRRRTRHPRHRHSRRRRRAEALCANWAEERRNAAEGRVAVVADHARRRRRARLSFVCKANLQGDTLHGLSCRPGYCSGMAPWASEQTHLANQDKSLERNEVFDRGTN